MICIEFFLDLDPPHKDPWNCLTFGSIWCLPLVQSRAFLKAWYTKFDFTYSFERLQICEVVFNLGRDIQDFDKLFQKNYYVILGDI